MTKSEALEIFERIIEAGVPQELVLHISPDKTVQIHHKMVYKRPQDFVKMEAVRVGWPHEY